MKNLLTVAFMLTMLTGYANDLKTTAAAANVTTVKFNNVKIGHKLFIKDAAYATLYTEEVKTAGNYTQYFDLTTLLNGSYTIELEKDSEILIRNFSVKNGVITYSNEKELAFYKPVASFKNDLIYVSQLSSYDEILEVQIYYNNELIHEDELTGSPVYSRIYKIDSTKKGTYTIVMKSGEREYFNDFTL